MNDNHPASIADQWSSLDKLPAYTIEQFRALSPAEQRVAIARDALAQLAARHFVAETGTYFELPFLSEPENEGRDLRDVILESESSCSVCAMGAIFASAVRLDDALSIDRSSSDSYGCYKWSRSETRPDIFNGKLGQFFDRRQQRLMETAFERTPEQAGDAFDLKDSWDPCTATDENGDDVNGDWRAGEDFEFDHSSLNDSLQRGNPDDVAILRRAIEFGRQYEEDEETQCLMAILENVVTNHGEFIP